MAKSLSPKKKKSASTAATLKIIVSKSKKSSPANGAVTKKRKKKKKKSSDMSIASDCSGLPTPKKKSKVDKTQILPVRGHTGKSDRSGGHCNYHNAAFWATLL